MIAPKVVIISKNCCSRVPGAFGMGNDEHFYCTYDPMKNSCTWCEKDVIHSKIDSLVCKFIDFADMVYCTHKDAIAELKMEEM